MNDRHHEDHRDHSDTDSENRQRRAQFVRAHRVDGHPSRFFYIDESHGDYSARSASIGSNRAARHAGHKPLITPTIDETPTPRTADQMLNSSGNPMAKAMSQAVPNPVTTPNARPIAA